jgi:ABC-type transporter Mla subunit MlaD
MEFVLHSIESHDRQIAELVDNGARLDVRIAANAAQIAAQSANIDKLVQVTNQDADAIRRLAAIAERHEARLNRVEGTES